MSTINGGSQDETFYLRTSGRSVTVDGGAGFDTLDVDWSDKTADLRGRFDDRYGMEALLDDYSAGVLINATRIERLIVRFGSGNDQFDLGGRAQAELDGGLGTDIFRGDFRGLTENITFALDEGATSVIGGQGSSIIGFERVQFFTGAGDDDLAGGAGADVLSGGAGANRLSGGGGDDQLFSAGGVNTVIGGAGDDRWSGDYRDAAALRLSQSGACAFALSDGSSVSGVEIVELSLGAGDDVIEIGQDVGQLSVDAGGGTDTVVANWSAATDSATGVYGGPAGVLQLFGRDTNDRATFANVEVLDVTFGAGDDRFSAIQPVRATLDGGAGTDFFYADFSASPFSLRFSVNHMADARGATIEDVTVRNFEQVELRTGAGDDRLTGGALDDRFFSGNGFDTIRGGGGSDTIYAGGGNDVVEGGGGADLLFGEAGIDTVTYATARGGVTVSLAARLAQQTGGAGIDLIEGFENLTGSSFADVLTGDAEANEINGGGGDDRVVAARGDDFVDGAAGNDTLVGGAGHDRLFGDLGDDTIAGGTGDDELFGSFGDDTIGGNAGGDYLEGFDGEDVLRGDAGADFLDGGNEDDLLLGGNGADRLFGGFGDDRLRGGAGADTLTGEGGADRFVFGDGDVGTSATAADVVADFNRADGDRLDLRGIDAASGAAGDQVFAFIGAGAFSAQAGELRYEQDAGGVFLQGDTDGDGAADFYIRVENVATLVAADVIL